MTPSGVQPITDESLDLLIDTARANMRKALRHVLEGNSIGMFEIAKQPLASGQSWSIIFAIMSEPIAAFIDCSVVRGLPTMKAVYDKAIPSNTLPGAPSNPPGFDFPV